MFSSTVLEVAIGLVFCYASISVISSSIYEAVSSLFKLRARTLLAGVKALLDDKSFTGLAKDIYDHALVNPRSDGNTARGEEPAMKPSYIEPAHFAAALIDSIQKGAVGFEQLKGKIEELPEGQIKRMLQGAYARADGKIENLEAALASWFDAAMDRVSGGYKRQAQLITFLFALAVAGLFNVDSFHLFRTLWNHPALIAQLATPAAQGAGQALQNLDVLPVGWGTPPSSIVVAFFGWLVTATSVLFGAPFWFDLLQRIVNLRGTGQKPVENETSKTAPAPAK